MLIPSSQISIILQGKVDLEITLQAIASIRRYLPSAQIILSTWENVRIPAIDYDVLVLNKDPGHLCCARKDKPVFIRPNNVNRQIVSTINGLKKAKNKYSLKMRTDFILTGTFFLNYFGKFDKFSDNLRCVTQRIICYNARHPDRGRFPFLYHPGDFFFFGLTADLINLFDIPLMTQADGEWFISNEPASASFYNRYAAALSMRYCPEQHIWLSFLRKHYPGIEYRDLSDNSFKNRELSDISYVNNLVFLDLKEFGIFATKIDLQSVVSIFHYNYGYRDWLLLYNKYIDRNSLIPEYIEIDYAKKIKLSYLKDYIFGLRCFLWSCISKILIIIGCQRIILTYDKWKQRLKCVPRRRKANVLYAPKLTKLT